MSINLKGEDMIKLNPMLETVKANRYMQSFVSASSNLVGTPNEKKAQRLANKIQKSVDIDTSLATVNSYKRSRAQISIPKEAPVVAAPVEKVAEEIIPEHSIFFIG